VAGPKVIDIHAHFFPEAFIDLIAEAGGACGGRVERGGAGPSLVTPEGRTPPLDPTYWDLDRRVRAMDRARVDAHALSLTLPMVYWADADLGARLARSVNDAMEAAHRAYPDRFVGCATLPMQEPARALEELDRVSTLGGIRAIYLGTNVNGRELSDPAYLPVFSRCAEARLPVFLHPINVIGKQRLAPFYLNNLLGNPFDTAIAAAHLVFGGILDRLPKLEVCLPHAGGALPYIAGRLRRGQRVRPEARQRAKKPFESYLRRFTYDTISHNAATLDWLVRTVGADRVMLGSDFCFDMGYERPREIVERQLRLGRADRARILGATAARLLRLG